MRGLFFKVFIIFWIAQSLIFVISTALIVRHHFEGPEALFDTLDSSLQNDGNAAVAAWERGGCGALEAYGASIAQTVSLADAAGQPSSGARSANNICGGFQSFPRAGNSMCFC